MGVFFASKNVEIDESKINSEFSCSIIKVKINENHFLEFVYGKAKNVEKTMEYLKSEVIKLFYKRDMIIGTRYITYPELFKTPKLELKKHNILQKSDKFEIKTNKTATLKTYDKDVDSIVTKISNFIQTFE